MRLRFKAFWIAALIASGAASAPALSQSQSQDAGWFIGAGGGIAKFRDGCPPVTPGLTCDDRGNAWKVFGGYQFNSYFGYEIAYGDLGKITQTQVGVSSATLEGTTIDLLLVLTIPLSREFGLYGKWGVANWDVERTITGMGAGSADASGRDITFGFGMSYSVGKHIALQLEFQRYYDIGDANFTGSSNVDLGSFRIVFRF